MASEHTDGTAPLAVPIVFVPGFQGSTLSRSGSRVWGDALTMMGCSSAHVDSSLEWEASATNGGRPIQVKDDVTEDGLFRVTCCGCCTLGSGYGAIETWADANDHVHLFAYDWRRDIFETMMELKEFVEDVLVVHKNSKQVHLMGHSMGGCQTCQIP